MIETCCLKNVVNFFAKKFKFCAIKKHYMTTILKTMTTAFFTSFYLLCEQIINISILTKLWTIYYSINKLNRSLKIFPEFSLGVMIFQEIPVSFPGFSWFSKFFSGFPGFPWVLWTLICVFLVVCISVLRPFLYNKWKKTLLSFCLLDIKNQERLNLSISFSGK